MTADLAFAQFLDWCCQRFAKHPAYRRTLRRELPEEVAHG